MATTITTHDLREVATLFDMRSDYIRGSAYGSGHINDTFCTTFDQAGWRVRYIMQRINTNIFTTPDKLMENIDRVTRHALGSLLAEGNPEARRRTLTCIPANDGKPYAVDSHGNHWRVYPFIERARGHDVLQTNDQAYEAALAFGNFQKLTADLGGERLHETIPDFHNTPKRLDALRAAVEVAPRTSARKLTSRFPAPRIAPASPTSSPQVKSRNVSPTMTPN